MAAALPFSVFACSPGIEVFYIETIHNTLPIIVGFFAFLLLISFLRHPRRTRRGSYLLLFPFVFLLTLYTLDGMYMPSQLEIERSFMSMCGALPELDGFIVATLWAIGIAVASIVLIEPLMRTKKPMPKKEEKSGQLG